MKICVLGAGVIGVSTAYALGRLGHEVSVIEKAPDVAMGASYANGAQLSYSYIDPLASPATFYKLPRYLLGRDTALQLKPSLNPAYLRWGLSFLRNCSAAQFQANRAARKSLSELSSDAMALFEEELGKKFEPTGRGKLVLVQSQVDYNALKSEKGFVDAQSCLDIEPTLKTWSGPILGGIYSETDIALNTLTYCRVLKELSQKKFGVQFHFNETASALSCGQTLVKGVQTNKQFHPADNIILCLGNDTRSLLDPLGVSHPIYPVYGYSLTLNATSSSPRVSITDLKNKIVYANLGSHFRIAGFVDVNQKAENINHRIDLLLKTARQTWPEAADFDGTIKRWHGARPMTPSGVPIIEETSQKGLYVNIGHGSLGYTFAAGSAMKVANMIGHSKTNQRSKRGKDNAA